MLFMFRSNRVCAVMLFQQGGPGRNPNEYMRQNFATVPEN